MLRRPESKGRQRGLGRTMVIWSLTMPSRWLLVRLPSIYSHCLFCSCRLLAVGTLPDHWICTAAFDHVASVWTTAFPFSVSAGRTVRTWTHSQCSLYPTGWPWQPRCVRTMGAVSCPCFLFPVSVSWCYSLERKLAFSAPHLLLDATLCNPLYGPVWPFIKTSQHLGRLVVRCPITCSLDLSFHLSIVLTKRVTQ